MTEEVKNSAEFKDLKVSNFRSKNAQIVRDKRLNKKGMGFLHQAIRYRGKANNRETLFLGYGKSAETIMSEFVDDQAFVLRKFLCMAGAFASRRLGKDLWKEFVNDVDKHSAFTSKALDIWA